MVALRARLALVSVTSEPPGALIFVDRRELGAFGNTPRTIVVAPGQHRIELLLPDHEASTQAIDAVVGRTVATAARLKVKTGSLVVRAAPRDAVIRAVRDGAAPLTLHSGRGASLPVGSYRVTAAAPGHAAGETVAVIRADAPTTLDLVLRPLPVPTGRLLVDTGTVPARVFIDGKPAAVTPATLPSVAAGRHRITLEARGYRPWSGTVEVRHGEATFVNATLTERGR